MRIIRQMAMHDSMFDICTYVFKSSFKKINTYIRAYNVANHM